MKNLILLLLLLPCYAYGQFPMVAGWQTQASGAFSPLDLDSLKMWAVAQDVIDSLGKADGDSTYLFPNRISRPRSGFQATSSQKPVVRSDSLNGHAVLVFDGVDDNMLASGIFSASDDYSVFVVMKRAKPLGVQVAVEAAEAVEWTARGFLLAQADADSSVLSCGGFMPLSQNTREMGITARIVSLCDTSSGAARFKVDGGGAAYATGAGNGDSDIVGRIFIGARSGPLFPAAASIAEMLVYSRKLNLEEETSVLDYLADKYSITISP